MKLPKLNLAAAKDEARPLLCNIYINGDEVVATDGHIIIIHERSLVECIDGLPDKCYIPATEWAELTKEFETARFVESENIILLTDKKGKKRVVSLADDDEVYPNYNALVSGLRIVRRWMCL